MSSRSPVRRDETSITAMTSWSFDSLELICRMTCQKKIIQVIIQLFIFWNYSKIVSSIFLNKQLFIQKLFTLFFNSIQTHALFYRTGLGHVYLLILNVDQIKMEYYNAFQFWWYHWIPWKISFFKQILFKVFTVSSHYQLWFF